MEDENDSREHKRASQIPTALSKSFCPKTYQFRTGCIPFSIAARWWLLRRGVMPLSRRPAVNRTWVCAGRAVDALVAWLGGADRSDQAGWVASRARGTCAMGVCYHSEHVEDY